MTILSIWNYVDTVYRFTIRTVLHKLDVIHLAANWFVA